MSLRQSPAAFLALGLIVLSVAACGRAGPLEAPPQKGAESPQAQQQAATDDEESGSGFGSPVPTPQKQPKRPITIPDRPLILDSIL